MSWACQVLNRTATTINPGDKSPNEMWYGSPPPPGEVWPFLKPAICRVVRDNKSQPKVQDCYYIGPSVDRPRDCMRVPTVHCSILTTRNVTSEERKSTTTEGTTREGASSQGRGRVEDLDCEPDLDMTEVWPLVPSATRDAPAVEPATGVGEGVRKSTTRHHRSLPGGTISMPSTSAAAAATTAAPAVTTTTATTAETFPRLWADLPGDWRLSVSPPHCKADARDPSRGA